MKLQLVKFNESVLFEGQQVSFLDTKRNNVQMNYDPSTLIVTLSSAKDTVCTNLHNCVYWRVVEVPVVKEYSKK